MFIHRDNPIRAIPDVRPLLGFNFKVQGPRHAAIYVASLAARF
jgi:hypothetical protein